MRMEWTGTYLDGKKARRQSVFIRLIKTGLEVTPEAGEMVFWPYHEVHQTDTFDAKEPIRLERGGEMPETIFISDPAFLTDLIACFPELGKRFHPFRPRTTRISLTFLAAIGTIGITTALYIWGIPAMALLITPYVPVSWEEHLGRGLVQVLAPPQRQCTNPTQIHAIEETLQTLIAPLPNPTYTFRVIVVNDPTINALAAPGGYILIFRGLLEKTESAEVFAGILAHELQHILRRHSTQAILKDASTGLVIAAITGDASGALTYGLETARMMGTLRYSRQNEEEADREGMRMMMTAKIDPQGMIAAFEMLKKEGGKMPDYLKHLSTHPNTQDRIEALKHLARDANQEAKKLLPTYDWQMINHTC